MDIRIEVLGGFDVRVGGEALSSLREQPIRAALLVFLAMEGEVTRDHVTGVLWPDQPPDRARHTLSQTLYRLRQDLGEGWVTTQNEFLQVADSVRVDAVEFMRAAGAVEADPPLGPKTKAGGSTPADPGGAIALYQGSFLAGWGRSVSSEFEHWCDRQDLRLSRLHREVCRTQTGQLRASGETEPALVLARHWADVDPMEDEAQHLVIELLAEMGRRAEALDAFQAYEELLASHDLQPLDETLALVKAIREGSRSPAPSGAEDVEPAPAYPPAVPTLPSAVPASAPNTAPSTPPPHATAPLFGVRVRRVALLAALAVLALFGAQWIYQGRGGVESTPSDWVPNRVLVASLENHTGRPDLASIGGLAADWITRGLSELRFLEVRPASEFMALDPGMNPQTDSGETGTMALASRLRAAILVSGNYYLSGPGLVFHVQILQLPGGHVMEAIGPVRSETSDPMEAVDIIRQRVAVALAIHLEEELAPLSASAFPPSLEAYQAYISGTRKFVHGDRAEAVADLEAAYHRAPGFTAPLLYAAFGRLGLGDPQGADSLAQILQEEKETLLPYDAFRLELLQALLRGDNAEGYRAVRQAAELLEGGSAHYMSAEMALRLNRPRQALEILENFAMSREWPKAWAPYWNVMTAAHHLLGNHEREIELAREGHELNPDRMFLLAWMVRALAAEGRWEEIEPLLARSRSIRGPDRMDPGAMMLLGAMELRRHGYTHEAMACLEEALAWQSARALDQPGSRAVRLSRARVLYQMGALQQRMGSSEAPATLREAQREFDAMAPESPNEPLILGQRAAIRVRLGDTAGARVLTDSLRKLDVPYLRGQHTLWRARIESLLGEQDEAVRLLWEAVGKGVSFGTAMHADPDLEPLLGFPPFQEFIRPKG